MEGASLANPIFKRLSGKVAIITGGASGMGESTARLYAQNGAKVVIADIQDDLGNLVSKELDGGDGTVSYIHCDVAKESDIRNVIDFTMSKYGKLDIMYSNAGYAGRGNQQVMDCDVEDIKRVFDVNVIGAFLCAKHAASVMIPAKKGSILFTSSLATVSAGMASHAYTSSKHAVLGLMKNLCVELGQHGIRVNCISPNAIATPMFCNATGLDKLQAEEVIEKAGTLKGSILEEKDVAEAAVFLGSDESKYVSGLNLLLDGGYSTTNPTMNSLMSDLLKS